jgi:hypothetical protein
MKRIYDGKTYNTDTSEKIAQMESEEAVFQSDPIEWEDTLFQTRGGAFFVVQKKTWTDRDKKGELGRREKFMFQPMTETEAHDFIMRVGAQVFHNPFEDPPEAENDEERGATVFVRTSTDFKHRIDRAAEKAGLSTNAWALRCFKNCLKGAAAA